MNRNAEHQLGAPPRFKGLIRGLSLAVDSLPQVKAGEKYTYRVIAVNGVGLKSEPTRAVRAP